MSKETNIPSITGRTGNITPRDIVEEMEESYFIEGNYEDDYRCFVLETNFDEGKR